MGKKNWLFTHPRNFGSPAFTSADVRCLTLESPRHKQVGLNLIN